MSLLLPVVVPALFAVAQAGEVQRWDFTDTDGGLTPGGDIGSIWQWGVVASGPGSGLGGASAWGTVLAGDYLNDARETLSLPVLNLVGVAEPALGITHWYAIDATGDGDFGTFEAWNGVAWDRLDPVYGYPTPDGFQGRSGEWTTHWFDLREFGETALLRVVLDSDLSGVDDGWYLGTAALVDGDAVPPQVIVSIHPEDNQDIEVDALVEATIIDDRAGVSAQVVWTDDSAGAGVETMTGDGDTWSAFIPAASPGVELVWHIEATDGTNVTVTAPDQYRTFLAPPQDLVGPDGPVAAQTATLSWQAPACPYPVFDYELLREGEVVMHTPSTSAEAPLVDGRPRFAVRARFDTPLGVQTGDLSEVVAVDAAVPTVHPLSPAQAWAGDQVRVVITGENLLLADGSVEIWMGLGVTVTDLDVRDVATMVAEVSIDPNADTGPRGLALVSGEQTLFVGDAFEVRDAADRPRVTQVTPDSLVQGERTTLIIQTTGGMASTQPVVWLGAGVVVESVTVDGDTLRVKAGTATDAPVGPHPIEIDDGVRILAGMDVEVRRPAAITQRSCSTGATGSAAAGALMFALGLVALRGRQRDRLGPTSSVKSKSTNP